MKPALTSSSSLRFEQLESRRVLAAINLADLMPNNGGDGSQGFIVERTGGLRVGRTVQGGGDFNHDGIDDFIVGEVNSIYVVFGTAAGFDATIDLALLDGSNGFRISEIESLANAGDFNGDGIDDLVAGDDGFTNGFNRAAGAGFIIYGRTDGFAAHIDPFQLSGTDGFQIFGQYYHGHLGRSADGQGDLNGDGFDDVVLGSPGISPYWPGSVHVIFGTSEVFSEPVTPDSVSGFRFLLPEEHTTGVGTDVSIGGDVNGDGFDDLVATNWNDGPYQLYVIYGRATGSYPGWPSEIDGTNGVVIESNERHQIGQWIDSHADLNADGYDDIVVGASFASPDGLQNAGRAYVLFGSEQGIAPDLQLDQLDGTNGFLMEGFQEDARLGTVSAAGDVNGDGVDDLLVAASRMDADGVPFAGVAYLLFGHHGEFDSEIDLANLSDDMGIAIHGVSEGDLTGSSVASAGDVNDDGYDDLVIGAERADLTSSVGGRAYVVYGGEFTPAIGDFNADGNLNGIDIDLLQANIVTGPPNIMYDIDGDGSVDVTDRDVWLAIAGEANFFPGFAYRLGDANLDGNVNGSDFLIWNTNKFTSNPQWTAGDFTISGNVDGADFLEWNTNKFSVPETQWTLRNRHYSNRFLNEGESQDARLTLASALWSVSATPQGVLVQSVLSQNYLASDDWNVTTVSSPTMDAYWRVIRNPDGSLSLQSKATGRFLDGDGQADGWRVDLSAEILDDDGWFVTVADPPHPLRQVPSGVVPKGDDRAREAAFAEISNPPIRTIAADHSLGLVDRDSSRSDRIARWTWRLGNGGKSATPSELADPGGAISRRLAALGLRF